MFNKTILTIFALWLPMALPLAAAAVEEETPYSCSVILGDGSSENNTCEFRCDTGSTITVSGSGTAAGGVHVGGSCGGAGAECSANNGVTCTESSSKTATAAGTGVCSITPDNPGGDPDAGTGSCAASQVSPPPPPEPDPCEDPGSDECCEQNPNTAECCQGVWVKPHCIPANAEAETQARAIPRLPPGGATPEGGDEVVVRSPPAGSEAGPQG